MVVAALPTPLAKPPGEVIVATEVFEEVQTAGDVRSSMVPLLYVPAHENCKVPPMKMLGFRGVMLRETSLNTVMVVDPEILPRRAEMFAVPIARAEATPVEVIVATLVFEEAQVTLPVMFCDPFV